MTPKILFPPILILALVLCGATCNKEKVAYNTIATVEQGVDASVKAYLDLVVNEKIPTNSVPRVMQAYDLVQLSVRAAIKASRGNSNAVAPVDLTTKAGDLQTLIFDAKMAGKDGK